MTALTGVDVARLLHAAGFPDDELEQWVAISHRESHWNPQAFNGDATTGDKSFGLYQINMIGTLGPSRRQAFGIAKDEELFDPAVNVRAAYVLRGWGLEARKDPFWNWMGYRGAAIPAESLAAAHATIVAYRGASVPQLYPYGYAGAHLTRPQIEARPDVAMLDPEVLRRAFALMDFAASVNVPLGIGGAGRAEGRQDVLYRSRYTVDPTDPPPCAAGHGLYLGQCWAHTSGAAAAIPGQSYHEACTAQHKALAIDWIGSMPWLGAHADEYGFYVIGNAEPWHTQPVEVPRSRRDYDPVRHALKPFPLPGTQPAPAPAPPPVVAPPVPVPGLNFTPANVVPGATGESVFLCQTILRLGASQPLVKPSGVYDAATAAGIANVQLFYGLKPDGLCGPKTWPVLVYVAQTVKLTDPS